MITVNRRAYAGETDLQAIANPIDTCEAIARLEEGTSSVDKVRDIRLLGDDSGKLTGFAQLSVPEVRDAIAYGIASLTEGWLWYRVHKCNRSAAALRVCRLLQGFHVHFARQGGAASPPKKIFFQTLDTYVVCM